MNQQVRMMKLMIQFLLLKREWIQSIWQINTIEEEELDPLEQANLRAENAEKEIAYKDAEIENVRKRLMAEKAELIQYSGMGLARRMLTVLADVDRALDNLDENDTSAVAQVEIASKQDVARTFCRRRCCH